MAHDTAGCHLRAKKTKEKIKLSFTWPTIASDVQKVCESCHPCQKRRTTVYDRTPITPIPRDEVPFDCLVMDCLGPLIPSQKVEFNYALVLCDSNTRYPFAFPLRSLSAKNVCNATIAAVSDHRNPIYYTVRLWVKFHKQFDHHISETVGMHT